MEEAKLNEFENEKGDERYPKVKSTLNLTKEERDVRLLILAVHHMQQ